MNVARLGSADPRICLEETFDRELAPLLRRAVSDIVQLVLLAEIDSNAVW